MMVHYSRKIAEAGILTALMFVACTEKDKENSARPNILLIVSEDNGADLGCYGNSIVHTPNLDRLAENGVRFNNAYVSNSVCSPSRGSIFTGLFPHQNGQIGWATHHYALYDGIKVLPQYLKEAGYRTGCIGKIHVNPEERFNFDFRAIPGSNFAKLNMPDYAANAQKFIQDNNSDAPYFLMVNYPDAHLPFQHQVEGLPSVKVDPDKITNTLPFVGVNNERLREQTEIYYNCMNRLDESVGMLLDSIGDLSNTVIIYISDHGAQFSRGKLTNYEGGLKIPFLVQWEEEIEVKNIVREELVSTVDILPTILELAGEKVPGGLPGRSILGLLQSDQDLPEWRDYLGADGEGESPVFYYPRRSIRGERYKLIHNIDVGREKFPAYTAYTDSGFNSGANLDEIQASEDKVRDAYALWENPPEWELYDLEKDPWEFENLSERPDYSTVLKKMKAALLEWRQQNNDPFLNKAKLDKFTREMDSINKLYPDHSYRNIENFSWDYLDYLNK